MSDEMNDLITEARRWANGHPNRRSGELMRELADALEAATREPSGGDREATEAEIDKAAIALHMAKCCSLSGDSPHDFPEASELFAAGVVLNAVPRAAVPDASTEELERVKPLFENLCREYPRECNKRASAEAERDAAVAALERVRAVADDWASDEDAKGLHFDLRAALDGAPEPEVLPVEGESTDA